MPECEFSKARSGGAYGHCTLIRTDVSSNWYKTLCTKDLSKCPYVAVCPKCGVKNAASSGFCSECGTDLKHNNTAQ